MTQLRFVPLLCSAALLACGPSAPADAGPEGTLVDRALEVERTLDGRVAMLRVEESYEGQLLPFAERFLVANAADLGIEDERVGFAPRGDHRLFGGTELSEESEVAVFSITVDGVPVYGSDVRLLGRAGVLRLIFVNAPPSYDIASTRPDLELTQAREAFAPALTAGLPAAGESSLHEDPRLTVFDRALFEPSRADFVLAWHAPVRTAAMGSLEVFVSAATGDLLGAISLSPEALSREIRDGDGHVDDPDAFGPGGAVVLYDESGARDVGEPPRGTLRYDDATELYRHFADIHEFLETRWGIDSFDTEGAPLRAAVGWGFTTPAAVFSAPEGVFLFSTGMVANDLAGHEVGHAALTHLGSGGPVFAGVPGAIHESLADALAHFVDANDYLIGEDAPARGTLRDMASPSALNQPECASALVPVNDCAFVGYLCDPDADHGGVHANSGVGNRALAILLRGSSADGGGAGACSEGDSVEVAPVRRDLVEQIYGAAFALVGRRPSYLDLRTTLVGACQALADAGDASRAECRQVANAFARVGVGPVAVAELSATITPSAATGVEGQPVTLTAGASGGAEPYVYRWNFGDGASSEAREAAHTYEAAGTYVITLEVEGAMGRSGDTTLTFEVEEGGPDQCRTYSESTRDFEPPVPELPDCPATLPAPAVTGTANLRLINNLAVQDGHLGRSRYCGYNVETGASSSFGFVGTISVHPAEDTERARPCAPFDCSSGDGYEVLVSTSEGNPWRYRYYDATHHLAWEGEASAVRDDPTLQPELDALVAALFEAFRGAALVCE